MKFKKIFLSILNRPKQTLGTKSKNVKIPTHGGEEMFILTFLFLTEQKKKHASVFKHLI